MQNDSVNLYALPVSCQKLMADNFQLIFYRTGLEHQQTFYNKEIYKVLQKTI